MIPCRASGTFSLRQPAEQKIEAGGEGGLNLGGRPAAIGKRRDRLVGIPRAFELALRLDQRRREAAFRLPQRQQPELKRGEDVRRLNLPEGIAAFEGIALDLVGAGEEVGEARIVGARLHGGLEKPGRGLGGVPARHRHVGAVERHAVGRFFHRHGNRHGRIGKLGGVGEVKLPRLDASPRQERPKPGVAPAEALGLTQPVDRELVAGIRQRVQRGEDDRVAKRRVETPDDALRRLDRAPPEHGGVVVGSLEFHAAEQRAGVIGGRAAGAGNPA